MSKRGNYKIPKKRCVQCNKPLKSGRTKYCNANCNSRFQKEKRKTTDLQKARINILKQQACEVCGWEETSRDIHHIVGIAAGGSNHSSNCITLCPNHHRCADRGLLSIRQLAEIVNKRKRRVGF